MMMMIIIVYYYYYYYYKGTTNNSHTGHCTHNPQSTNVQVHNILHVRNNIRCTQNENTEQPQHYTP